jgi:hypothetical protein
VAGNVVKATLGKAPRYLRMRNRLRKCLKDNRNARIKQLDAPLGYKDTFDEIFKTKKCWKPKSVSSMSDEQYVSPSVTSDEEDQEGEEDEDEENDVIEPTTKRSKSNSISTVSKINDNEQSSLSLPKIENIKKF